MVQRGPEEGVPFEAIPRQDLPRERAMSEEKRRKREGKGGREGRTESLFSQARAAAFE